MEIDTRKEGGFGKAKKRHGVYRKHESWRKKNEKKTSDTETSKAQRTSDQKTRRRGKEGTPGAAL